jgi:predicted 3-demethylubiquinone-9 3-methyltransferase (glyoxalase superfamily)
MELKMKPCLWFDSEAEEAARFYAGIFKNSKITAVTQYPEFGQEITGKKPGSVLTVEFELDGQPFMALNGGPEFKFSEAVSIVIDCEDQKEVDYYWDKLSAGGAPEAQQCGWLKDRYGLSWQVVPKVMYKMLTDKDKAKRERFFEAMMSMKKLDVAALERAYEGKAAAA